MTVAPQAYWRAVRSVNPRLFEIGPKTHLVIRPYNIDPIDVSMNPNSRYSGERSFGLFLTTIHGYGAEVQEGERQGGLSLEIQSGRNESGAFVLGNNHHAIHIGLSGALVNNIGGIDRLGIIIDAPQEFIIRPEGTVAKSVSPVLLDGLRHGV